MWTPIVYFSYIVLYIASLIELDGTNCTTPWYGRVTREWFWHIICWVFVRFLDQTYYIWSRFKKKILGHAHLSPNIKSFPVIFSRSLRAIVFGAQTRIDSSTTTTSVYRRKDFLMLLKLAILSIMNKSSKIRIWQITIVI